MNGVHIEHIITFGRVKIGKEKYTSEIYQRQKKRKNRYIYWDQIYFGKVLCFLETGDQIFAMTRELIKSNTHADVIVNNIPY